MTVQYVIPSVPNAVTFSDKIVKKFSGYMHEDATKFLREFDISSDTDSCHAVAAFHLHLLGLAFSWFYNISDKSFGVSSEVHFLPSIVI